MDPISTLLAGKTIQGVTRGLLRALESDSEQVSEITDSTDSAGQSTSESSSSGDFDVYLRGLLHPGADNQVSEEALYAALLQERIQSLKGEEGGSEFQAKLAERKAELTRADGYVAVEDAANQAMMDLVEAGVLTEEEASTVKAQSFRAAQLDDNLSALYDGRGGPGDPTIAVADMESALVTARSLIQQLEDGTLELTDEDLQAASGDGETITPSGTSVDGNEGFVFKPESDSDGRLVVILPADLTNQISDVLLKDEDDTILERGRMSGVANGGREHFRFEQAGGDYPENLTVEVRMTNGEILSYEIPNPSERYD
ncbi:MAG: hypothetical protein KDD64_05595 [Bdellovibrionales bacterium]|nr:hypothetical protein [Bdellovibrionales bacterium]